MGIAGLYFVYFRHFLIPSSIIQIEKSLNGVLVIQTQGCRIVGADKTTELWLWTFSFASSTVHIFQLFAFSGNSMCNLCFWVDFKILNDSKVNYLGSKWSQFFINSSKTVFVSSQKNWLMLFLCQELFIVKLFLDRERNGRVDRALISNAVDEDLVPTNGSLIDLWPI